MVFKMSKIRDVFPLRFFCEMFTELNVDIYLWNKSFYTKRSLTRKNILFFRSTTDSRISVHRKTGIVERGKLVQFGAACTLSKTLVKHHVRVSVIWSSNCQRRHGISIVRPCIPIWNAYVFVREFRELKWNSWNERKRRAREAFRNLCVLQ